MPHINLVFPFVPVSEFPNCVVRLKTALSEFPAFVLSLDDVSFFPQKRNKTATYHLQPSITSNIDSLFAVVSSALGTKNTKKFHAHMTLGQCEMSEIQTVLTETQAWLGDGFDCVIDHVSLISRDPNNRTDLFRVVDVVKLGGTN
ncbi:hypothetical protein HK100_001453 [Physocladia obscura]|uniref:2'-5' RNA ligase n=1 Tax=Physocladia obscura TaxID=109957 RepID=A0AAD5SZE9_9FUNG|nr:hypothetical protein HK100_001453 [Physocladia obscura]